MDREDFYRRKNVKYPNNGSDRETNDLLYAFYCKELYAKFAKKCFPSTSSDTTLAENIYSQRRYNSFCETLDIYGDLNNIDLLKCLVYIKAKEQPTSLPNMGGIEAEIKRDLKNFVIRMEKTELMNQIGEKHEWYNKLSGWGRDFYHTYQLQDIIKDKAHCLNVGFCAMFEGENRLQEEVIDNILRGKGPFGKISDSDNIRREIRIINKRRLRIARKKQNDAREIHENVYSESRGKKSEGNKRPPKKRGTIRPARKQNRINNNNKSNGEERPQQGRGKTRNIRKPNAGTNRKGKTITRGPIAVPRRDRDNRRREYRSRSISKWVNDNKKKVARAFVGTALSTLLAIGGCHAFTEHFSQEPQKETTAQTNTESREAIITSALSMLPEEPTVIRGILEDKNLGNEAEILDIATNYAREIAQEAFTNCSLPGIVTGVSADPSGTIEIQTDHGSIEGPINPISSYYAKGVSETKDPQKKLAYLVIARYGGERLDIEWDGVKNKPVATWSEEDPSHLTINNGDYYYYDDGGDYDDYDDDNYDDYYDDGDFEM